MKTSEMNNTSFIKWLCDKTEFYNIEDGVAYYTCEDDDISVFSKNRGILNPGLYRDLLQSAIKGVNSENNYDIQQNRSNISITDLYTGITRGWELVPGEETVAKLSALRYIWERFAIYLGEGGNENEK